MGNILRRLISSKEVRILMIGLDAAGKTSVLYRLKLGEMVTTIPTIGFNIETLSYKNIKFTAWDVGSRDKIRPLWRHYYPNTQAILFVVDSNDRERLPEVKSELWIQLDEEELKEAVLVVVANKQDLPGAMSVLEISEALGLDNIKNHVYGIFGTSALTGDGLYEPLDWLCTKLTTKEVKTSVKSSVNKVEKLSPLSYFTDTLSNFKNYMFPK